MQHSERWRSKAPEWQDYTDEWSKQVIIRPVIAGYLIMGERITSHVAIGPLIFR